MTFVSRKNQIWEVSEDVVRRACRGDTLAVAAIYDHYEPRLYRFLAARSPDLVVAQDLTADVFLRMVRALPGYQVQGIPFSVWLFQIARNLLTDHFRQQKVHQNVELVDDMPDRGLNLEVIVENSLLRASLRKAMADLPQEQADALALRFLAGLPIAETARTMGKSEDAIKGLQRRGLIAMRNVLSEREV